MRGMLPLGVNRISQPTAQHADNPGGSAPDPGIYADPPVLIIFLIGRTDRTSHDGCHNHKTGHEERGKALCIVQGAADPHEPESQVGTECAVHVIELRKIFFIKYSTDVIGSMS